MMQKKYGAALFDLDGVIVDTARYHYLAWKALALELGIDFTEKDNERLKGVSRMQSLDILLELGGRNLPEGEKQTLAARKNEAFLGMVNRMTAAEILPGARELISTLRAIGVKVALASSSRNAERVLNNLQITPLFDAIVDGNMVERAKPDPQLFLLAAQKLGMLPEACVVFEDAGAGVQAAHAAGMFVVGVGAPEMLAGADVLVGGLEGFNPQSFFLAG